MAGERSDSRDFSRAGAMYRPQKAAQAPKGAKTTAPKAASGKGGVKITSRGQSVPAPKKSGMKPSSNVAKPSVKKVAPYPPRDITKVKGFRMGRGTE